MAIQYVPEYAEITSNLAATYNITASSNLVQISVDGGSVQTATLTNGATQTAANIVSDLSVITGITASVITINGVNYVQMRTNSTLGAGSTIQIFAPTNNANGVLGFPTATITGNPRVSLILNQATTKQVLINWIEASLLRCGWTTISGSGTTNVLLQAGTTPQNLRFRLRLRDHSSTCVHCSFENVSGTRVSTTSTTAGGIILPSNRPYRIIANKYQAFIMSEGALPSEQRSAVYFGVPWIPSNLVGTIYEAIWLYGNGANDTDNTGRAGFREILGTRSVSTATGNQSLLLNNTLWENNNNTGLDNIGMMTLLTLWQGARLTRNTFTWFRWFNNSQPMIDPLIAWGATASTDEAKVRGMLWDSFIMTGFFAYETIDTDGKKFYSITTNNIGTDHHARGTLWTAIQ